MSIGIDERSNSLVVRAPDPLFEEVKALVAELDQTDLSSPETTRVVSLQVHQLGGGAEGARPRCWATRRRLRATSAANHANQDRGGDNNPDRQARRQFRRQMEMFRQMRDMQRMQNGGGGGDGGGRGGGAAVAVAADRPAVSQAAFPVDSRVVFPVVAVAVTAAATERQSVRAR